MRKLYDSEVRDLGENIFYYKPKSTLVEELLRNLGNPDYPLDNKTIMKMIKYYTSEGIYKELVKKLPSPLSRVRDF